MSAQERSERFGDMSGVSPIITQKKKNMEEPRELDAELEEKATQGEEANRVAALDDAVRVLTEELQMVRSEAKRGFQTPPTSMRECLGWQR